MNTTEMIKQSKAFYKSIGSLYSKAIKENVIFNRHGLNHLIFNGAGKRRLEGDIRRRLHLIKNVPEVIKKSTSFLEEKRDIFVNGVSRSVTYYELSHEVSSTKGSQIVTVVVRKFDIGPFHYYTVRSRTKKRP